MNIPIPSILLGLGGKCLLNWSLVFLQRSHICRSFLGVFSVSLAVVDTALSLTITAIHIHSDGVLVLLGFPLTRYHVCLLVQILGRVYSVLQWPVVVVGGLDHFCTVYRRFQTTAFRARWYVCSLVMATVLLWSLAVLYVFRLSDFIPVLDDTPHYQIHRCWVSHMPQVLQVITVLLFLSLGCALFHAGFLSCCTPQLFSNSDILTQQSRSFVHQTLSILLNTWALFLAVLVVLLLLPLVIPAHLIVNVAWLCFTNSLLIGTVLCVTCPASQVAQGLAALPPDSFCEWKFKLSQQAEHETARSTFIHDAS